VPVAILAQGTYSLIYDGILLSSVGCDSVFTVGNLSQYLFIRYLCKLPGIALAPTFPVVLRCLAICLGSSARNSELWAIRRADGGGTAPGP
jgi:hypothetical protein